MGGSCCSVVCLNGLCGKRTDVISALSLTPRTSLLFSHGTWPCGHTGGVVMVPALGELADCKRSLSPQSWEFYRDVHAPRVRLEVKHCLSRG